MENRRFGNSDLSCSALGFGTWEMSTTQYGAIDVGEASRAVHGAIDAGITLFDTAEQYGPYHSEALLGNALGPRRKEVVVVTKIGWHLADEPEPHIIGRNSRYDWLMSRIEGCLRRLQTDWIDLLLIHWPDHDTPYTEPMRALEDLKAAGKIRYYGVSNYAPAWMDVCEQVGHLTTNQIGYNMLDRRVEHAVLPYCAEHEIGFMSYGTLCYGLLTGAFTPDTKFSDGDWRRNNTAFGLSLFERENFLRELRLVERLKIFAADHGKTVAQLAIAWALSHPAVTVGLVGMRNTKELMENVAAVDWKLTEADKVDIDRLFEEEGVPTHAGRPIAF